jgi:hypothetical protein
LQNGGNNGTSRGFVIVRPHKRLSSQFAAHNLQFSFHNDYHFRNTNNNNNNRNSPPSDDAESYSCSASHVLPLVHCFCYSGKSNRDNNCIGKGKTAYWCQLFQYNQTGLFGFGCTSRARRTGDYTTPITNVSFGLGVAR